LKSTETMARKPQAQACSDISAISAR